MSIILRSLACLALAACLALSPAFPETTNTVLLVAMAGSVLIFAWDVRHGRLLALTDALPLLGMGILAIALVPTTRSIANYFVLLALAPVALALPLSSLIGRAGRWASPISVSALALVGTVLAAGITGYDALVRGLPRGGQLTMNPIHMGDLALLLGFIALAGVFEGRSHWRWLLLLGPGAGLLAVHWSGSRGPLLAYGVLLILTLAYAAWIWLPAKRRLPAMLGIVLSVFAALVLGIQLSLLEQIPGADQVINVLSGSAAAVDSSTQDRLQMYEGAWHAFWYSPLFGVGGESFTAVAGAFVSEQAMVSASPHLHADIANFAVIGGSLGLVSYVLLLSAPLVAGAHPGPQRPTRFYLGMVTTFGFMAMGLTNAMFGILTLTIAYAVVLSVLSALRR